VREDATARDGLELSRQLTELPTKAIFMEVLSPGTESDVMTANAVRLDLRILVYPEDSFWIAHCLETDLVAEGSSPKEAIEGLIDISNTQIEALLAEGDLNSLFSPAPPEIWRMFATADDNERASRRPSRAVKPINRISVRQLASA
jgi:hypothetical protein